jgi:hypothetical protein
MRTCKIVGVLAATLAAVGGCKQRPGTSETLDGEVQALDPQQPSFRFRLAEGQVRLEICMPGDAGLQPAPDQPCNPGPYADMQRSLAPLPLAKFEPAARAALRLKDNDKGLTKEEENRRVELEQILKEDKDKMDASAFKQLDEEYKTLNDRVLLTTNLKQQFDAFMTGLRAGAATMTTVDFTQTELYFKRLSLIRPFLSSQERFNSLQDRVRLRVQFAAGNKMHRYGELPAYVGKGESWDRVTWVYANNSCVKLKMRLPTPSEMVLLRSVALPDFKKVFRDADQRFWTSEHTNAQFMYVTNSDVWGAGYLASSFDLVGESGALVQDLLTTRFGFLCIAPDSKGRQTDLSLAEVIQTAEDRLLATLAVDESFGSAAPAVDPTRQQAVAATTNTAEIPADYFPTFICRYFLPTPNGGRGFFYAIDYDRPNAELKALNYCDFNSATYIRRGWHYWTAKATCIREQDFCRGL